MDSKEKITIRRIRKGDKEIFVKLFDLYYQRLFLYARSYVRNDEEAEDMVQNVFLHLWEKRKDLVIFSSVSAYLFRSIHNRSIQHLRHQKVVAKHAERHKLRIREAEILYNSSADFSFSEQQIKEIQQIFNKTNNLLPEKTREIFRLSRGSSKTNKEIAGMLGITIKAVEYHITKALKVFNTALKDYFMIF
ncbi:MAG: RNA polymerase sigma-70 factor [Bacteroidales bacterium]|jgi:RNA polymerase sigma-70 factor (ECF subfamily)